MMILIIMGIVVRMRAEVAKVGFLFFNLKLRGPLDFMLVMHLFFFSIGFVCTSGELVVKRVGFKDSFFN